MNKEKQMKRSWMNYFPLENKDDLRRRIGEESPAHILSDSDVRQIKEMLEEGVRGSELAKFFGISPTTISCIKHGIYWGHISVKEEKE